MTIGVVMVLRVYAMYNRSRIILVPLLVLYITEVVILFVSSSIYSDPNYVAGTFHTTLTLPRRPCEALPYSVGYPTGSRT